MIPVLAERIVVCLVLQFGCAAAAVVLFITYIFFGLLMLLGAVMCNLMLLGAVMCNLMLLGAVMCNLMLLGAVMCNFARVASRAVAFGCG
jgi:hypothetical protein